MNCSITVWWLIRNTHSFVLVFILHLATQYSFCIWHLSIHSASGNSVFILHLATQYSFCIWQLSIHSASGNSVFILHLTTQQYSFCIWQLSLSSIFYETMRWIIRCTLKYFEVKYVFSEFSSSLLWDSIFWN